MSQKRMTTKSKYQKLADKKLKKKNKANKKLTKTTYQGKRRRSSNSLRGMIQLYIINLETSRSKSNSTKAKRQDNQKRRSKKNQTKSE